MPEQPRTTFADYKHDSANWITLASGQFYPDILQSATALYQPVLVLFGQLLKQSDSSIHLLLQISEVKQPWLRVQLGRVFRKYVSPGTPVEMLKRKRDVTKICEQFGGYFRPVPQVQAAFSSRPMPDEALCAVLWEYKDRGQKGYDLTERFFQVFRETFPNLEIVGPERSGRDVPVGHVFPDYQHPRQPVDFVIFSPNRLSVLAIGLARYDSDRGGAQEDDKTGGYFNAANEILAYTQRTSPRTKMIFVNDGPGLLLGSMWDDYVRLENSWPRLIMVLTLRMIPERLTYEWLIS